MQVQFVRKKKKAKNGEYVSFYFESSVLGNCGATARVSEVTVGVDNISFNSLMRVLTVAYSLVVKLKSFGLMLPIFFAS